MSALYSKLRPGPGRSPAKVSEHQRTRLLGAMIEMLAEHGYEKVTVRELSRLAGVSTGTFYKHFANVEECFAFTYESLMRRTLRRAIAQRRAAGGGAPGLRAALRSLVSDLVDSPKEARLVLVEAYAAGPPMRPLIDRYLRALARVLGDESLCAERDRGSRRTIARGLAAGVTCAARAGIAAEPAALSKLEEGLADWVLTVRATQVGFSSTAARVRQDLPRRVATSEEDLRRAVFGAVQVDTRERILSAVVKLNLAGTPEPTTAEICVQAGVSRRAYRAEFATSRQCVVESVDRLVASTAALVRDTDKHSSNNDPIGEAVEVLCDQAGSNPSLARLCFGDTLEADRPGFDQRGRWIAFAADRFLAAASPGEAPAIDAIAQAAVACAARVVAEEVDAGRANDLPFMAPLLTAVLWASVPARAPLAATLVSA